MFKKNLKTLIYFIVIVVSFIVLFVPAEFVAPLKTIFLNTQSLPLRIVAFPFMELKKILFYHRTYRDYVRLQTELNVLKTKIVGMSEILHENQRLARLLNIKQELNYPQLAANVIMRDPSRWSASIVIDKGKEDGVEVGMPVINAFGVVGKIAEVSEHKAKAVLLTDPSFSVAALVARSREVGLVAGTIQGLCRMRYLSDQSDVQPGDQIMTSKLSSAFPEGLMVGEVIEVKPSASSPTLDCLIRPAVSLSQIEEVLVIKRVEK